LPDVGNGKSVTMAAEGRHAPGFALALPQQSGAVSPAPTFRACEFFGKAEVSSGGTPEALLHKGIIG
jgi:hypothetical protein